MITTDSENGSKFPGHCLRERQVVKASVAAGSFEFG